MAYQMTPPPSDPKQLASYLMQELAKLQEALASPVERVSYTPLHAAPLKPREGDLACADGTDWNPGSGAGLYEYLSGAWSKL